MEIAIPLILLGATYIITETNKKADAASLGSGSGASASTDQDQEAFSGMQQYGPTAPLPNTQNLVSNYPIPHSGPTADGEMYNSINYPTHSAATNSYLDQTQYQSSARAGVKVGNQIQQQNKVTGVYDASTEFSHNNMVPFTRRRPGEDISGYNVAERVLDTYTGAGSQQTHKTERAPLFMPEQDMNWVHGAPNVSDFLQTRVNPAQRNHMVLPFTQQRVAPGLDEKYGSEGSSGFNAGMEQREAWMPKPVNELRSAINPKIEYSLDGLQGPAAAGVKNRGILGKMEKYHTDTYYDNTPNRWLTTNGSEKGPRVLSEELLRQSHREETSVAEFGPASSALKTASYVPSNYTPSTRPELPSPQIHHSNASGHAPPESMVNRSQGFVASTTKRGSMDSDSNQPTFGAGFRAAVGAVVAPIMDVLKPTRKEDYSTSFRAGNTGVNKIGGYIRSSDPVDMTTKETTLHKTRGNIGYQTSNGYQTANYTPVEQNRNTSDTGVIMGASSARGNIDYSSQYNQAPSDNKETTLVNHSNVGGMSMLNHNMNVSLRSDIQPGWYTGPYSGSTSGPTVQSYGHHHTAPELREVGIERIEPAIMDAYNRNPYAININGPQR